MKGPLGTLSLPKRPRGIHVYVSGLWLPSSSPSLSFLHSGSCQHTSSALPWLDSPIEAVCIPLLSQLSVSSQWVEWAWVSSSTTFGDLHRKRKDILFTNCNCLEHIDTVKYANCVSGCYRSEKRKVVQSLLRCLVIWNERKLARTLKIEAGQSGLHSITPSSLSLIHTPLAGWPYL